jgi:AcrR family transcriptional regulator
MAPRIYRMDTRAEAANETRERILEATLALHAKHGVLAVSHKDIAQRADVSVGTVYHHFPTRTELVHACGARSAALHAPNAQAIDPNAPMEKRIAALVRELVAVHRLTPWLEKIRAERDVEPGIAHLTSKALEALDALIRRALGPTLSRRRHAVAAVAAILDVSVVNRLSQRGMSERDIAATLTSIVVSWLKGGHS